MSLERFAGGPYTRGDTCALPAHYAELQALCDALGHAAQLDMADAIQRGDSEARELAYGKWLGVRGILRAVEARTDEWTPREKEMLERIHWPDQQFRFPGIESFNVELSEPSGEPGRS